MSEYLEVNLNIYIYNVYICVYVYIFPHMHTYLLGNLWKRVQSEKVVIACLKIARSGKEWMFFSLMKIWDLNYTCKKKEREKKEER